MRMFHHPALGGVLAASLVFLAPGCSSKEDTVLAQETEVTPNPVPVLSSLSPAAIPAGSAATLLTLTGTEFMATSTVAVDGTATAATYVGATQLTLTLAATGLAEAGTHTVTVTNPTPGGGTSSSLSYTVENAVPTLTSLSPASLVAGTASGTLTLTGTSFLAGSTVTFNGEDHAVSSWSSTELTVALTASDLATVGAYPVVVTNPAPGGGSATGTFNVTADTTVRVVPTLTIATTDGVAITSKETYVTCTLAIDGMSVYSDYSGTGKIRGRGNSTWEWYDKKPYRIKLDTKSEILGLSTEKDWVLLANYRDPTFLMNAFAFEMADWMGLPYTNHSRFLEVTLNGTYIGLYQLTEQVEQGSKRVAVADDGGLLLSMDLDDGPSLSPDSGDNFWSSTYGLPICVKYPEDQTADQLAAIQAQFKVLEDAVASGDYDTLAAVMDIGSLIDFLLIQELTDNVELEAPRSMNIFKDPSGLFTMGPVWDFDGGFSFDWSTMYTGHDYFGSQGLILGTSPAQNSSVSDFYVKMFSSARFVTEYKARWTALRPTLLSHCFEVMDTYAVAMTDAMARNAACWPTDKDWATEVTNMKAWLTARAAMLDSVISAYPGN